jgi:predicted nucleic acid-binding protein
VLVVDASVAAEWLLNQARAHDAQAILARAASEDIWVPSLFWWEVANVLRTRVRRGLVDLATRDFLVARLRAVGLKTEMAPDLSGNVLDRTVALSDRFDLTVYDAAYLEVALRLGADLGTFDDDLAQAGIGAGLVVTGASARP